MWGCMELQGLQGVDIGFGVHVWGLYRYVGLCGVIGLIRSRYRVLDSCRSL